RAAGLLRDVLLAVRAVLRGRAVGDVFHRADPEGREHRGGAGGGRHPHEGGGARAVTPPSTATKRSPARIGPATCSEGRTPRPRSAARPASGVSGRRPCTSPGSAAR